MSDAKEEKNGARRAGGKRLMSMANEKKRRKEFEEEFNRWISELEQQIESTRRSELLTQEDYAIQINAQG